jgi:hypothetical protein
MDCDKIVAFLDLGPREGSGGHSASERLRRFLVLRRREGSGGHSASERLGRFFCGDSRRLGRPFGL